MFATPIFLDRYDAGRKLATALERFADKPGLLVLGLPRGGVPVAFEVAKALHTPLEVFVVRKIGAPWNPEFAVGAIASGGITFIDEWTAFEFGVRRDDIIRTIVAERQELARREALYRGTREFPPLAGRTIMVVDDGLATGSTMRAAVQAIRTQKPAEIIVAVPVSPPQPCEALAKVADEVVCFAQPDAFDGVGRWYQDFSETCDDEVLALLKADASLLASQSPAK